MIATRRQATPQTRTKTGKRASGPARYSPPPIAPGVKKLPITPRPSSAGPSTTVKHASASKTVTPKTKSKTVTPKSSSKIVTPKSSSKIVTPKSSSSYLSKANLKHVIKSRSATSVSTPKIWKGKLPEVSTRPPLTGSKSTSALKRKALDSSTTPVAKKAKRQPPKPITYDLGDNNTLKELKVELNDIFKKTSEKLSPETSNTFIHNYDSSKSVNIFSPSSEYDSDVMDTSSPRKSRRVSVPTKKLVGMEMDPRKWFVGSLFLPQTPSGQRKSHKSDTSPVESPFMSSRVVVKLTPKATVTSKPKPKQNVAVTPVSGTELQVEDDMDVIETISVPDEEPETIENEKGEEKDEKEIFMATMNVVSIHKQVPEVKQTPEVKKKVVAEKVVKPKVVKEKVIKPKVVKEKVIKDAPKKVKMIHTSPVKKTPLPSNVPRIIKIGPNSATAPASKKPIIKTIAKRIMPVSVFCFEPFSDEEMDDLPPFPDDPIDLTDLDIVDGVAEQDELLGVANMLAEEWNQEEALRPKPPPPPSPPTKIVSSLTDLTPVVLGTPQERPAVVITEEPKVEIVTKVVPKPSVSPRITIIPKPSGIQVGQAPVVQKQTPVVQRQVMSLLPKSTIISTTPAIAAAAAAAAPKMLPAPTLVDVGTAISQGEMDYFDDADDEDEEDELDDDDDVDCEDGVQLSTLKTSRGSSSCSSDSSEGIAPISSIKIMPAREPVSADEIEIITAAVMANMSNEFGVGTGMTAATMNSTTVSSVFAMPSTSVANSQLSGSRSRTLVFPRKAGSASTGDASDSSSAVSLLSGSNLTSNMDEIEAEIINADDSGTDDIDTSPDSTSTIITKTTLDNMESTAATIPGLKYEHYTLEVPSVEVEEVETESGEIISTSVPVTQRQEFIVVHLPEGSQVKSKDQESQQLVRMYFDESSQMYKCLECGYTSNKKLNMYKHRKIHGGDRPYTCDRCDYSATTSSNLKRHIAIHTDERTYPCSYCLLHFRQKIHLDRHIKYKHEDKKVKCPFCEYTCAVENPDLKAHIRRRHMASLTGDNEVGTFPCTECDHVATTRRDLKQHEKFHKPGPEVKLFCEHCSFVANCESRLERHKLTHTNIKPFACDLCSYRGTQKGHVLRHMRHHHGIDIPIRLRTGKGDELSINDDSVEDSIGDEEAMLSGITDTVEEIAQSGEPGSKNGIAVTTADGQGTFGHLTDFSSTEKIFACNHCTMKFSKLINLYKHLHTQHKELMPNELDEFACVVCDYRTNSRNNLLVHMRKHNMQDHSPPSHVYSCVLCSYVNPRRRNLFMHMKKKHKIEIVMKGDGSANFFIAENSNITVLPPGDGEAENLLAVGDVVTTSSDDSRLQLITQDPDGNSEPRIVRISDLANAISMPDPEEDNALYADDGSDQDDEMTSNSLGTVQLSDIQVESSQAADSHAAAAEAIEGLQALAGQQSYHIVMQPELPPVQVQTVNRETVDQDQTTALQIGHGEVVQLTLEQAAKAGIIIEQQDEQLNSASKTIVNTSLPQQQESGNALLLSGATDILQQVPGVVQETSPPAPEQPMDTTEQQVKSEVNGNDDVLQMPLYQQMESTDELAKMESTDELAKNGTTLMQDTAIEPKLEPAADADTGSDKSLLAGQDVIYTPEHIDPVAQLSSEQQAVVDSPNSLPMTENIFETPESVEQTPGLVPYQMADPVAITTATTAAITETQFGSHPIQVPAEYAVSDVIPTSAVNVATPDDMSYMVYSDTSTSDESKFVQGATEAANVLPEDDPNSTSIQLSAEQLMGLSQGDYVEINGEMYKVEFADQ